MSNEWVGEDVTEEEIEQFLKKYDLYWRGFKAPDNPAWISGIPSSWVEYSIYMTPNNEKWERCMMGNMGSRADTLLLVVARVRRNKDTGMFSLSYSTGLLYED